jgi:hypothetical protein
MNGPCSTQGKDMKLSTGNLEKPRSRCEDDIKMYLEDRTPIVQPEVRHYAA